MNLTILQLRALRNIVLIMGLWPTIVLAGSSTIANEFAAIPSLAYIITFVTSALGGLAGTLHRMSKYLEPSAPGIRHPKLFVAANMFGGLSAGWFAFLAFTSAGTPTLLVQDIILLAAFGGAATIDRFMDKYLPPTKKEP
jgi:hypothetical protein